MCQTESKQRHEGSFRVACFSFLRAKATWEACVSTTENRGGGGRSFQGPHRPKTIPGASLWGLRRRRSRSSSTCSGDGEESNREMSNVCWFYSGYCVKNVELVCKRMNVSHCHSFCQRCLSPSHFTFLLSVLLSVPCYMTKTPCVALFLYRNIHSVGVDIVKGSACVFAKLNLYIQFLDLNFRGCW